MTSMKPECLPRLSHGNHARFRRSAMVTRCAAPCCSSSSTAKRACSSELYSAITLRIAELASQNESSVNQKRTTSGGTGMHRAHGVRRPGPPRPGHASPSEVQDARVILRGKARLLQRPDSAHVQHQDVQHQDVRKQRGGLADIPRSAPTSRLHQVRAIPPAQSGRSARCRRGTAPGAPRRAPAVRTTRWRARVRRP